MTRQDIEETIGDEPSWQQADGDAQTAFVKEMADRNYGYMETLDSWEWFYSGWKAQARAVAARG